MLVSLRRVKSLEIQEIVNLCGGILSFFRAQLQTVIQLIVGFKFSKKSKAKNYTACSNAVGDTYWNLCVGPRLSRIEMLPSSILNIA